MNENNLFQESKYFKQSYLGGVARLVIAEVYAEDAGEYKVSARNESGTARSSCDVRVIGASAVSCVGRKCRVGAREPGPHKVPVPGLHLVFTGQAHMSPQKICV